MGVWVWVFEGKGVGSSQNSRGLPVQFPTHPPMNMGDQPALGPDGKLRDA